MRHSLRRVMGAGATFTLLTVACGGEPSQPAVNPLPTLNATVPDTMIVGSLARGLTVRGSEFTTGSRARVNGGDRATTFRSATEVLAELTVADLDTTRPLVITIVTPPPGGGTSGQLVVPVVNPGIVLRSVEPATLPVTVVDSLVVLRGSGFTRNTRVVADPAGYLVVSFVSDSVLHLRPGAGYWSFAGIRRFTAANLPPSRASSGVVEVTVENPRPAIDSITPDSIVADADSVLLSVFGRNLPQSSVVHFDGVPQAIYSREEGTVMRVWVNGERFRAPSDHAVTVVSPGPGGGVSVPRTFRSFMAPVRITSVSPASITEGALGLTLQVTGRNFAPGVTARANGTLLATAIVNLGRIALDIPSSMIARATTLRIEIRSPGFHAATFNIPVLPRTFAVTREAHVPLAGQAMVVDTVSGRLYVTVAESDATFGGSVVVIDPATAGIVRAIRGPTAIGAIAISPEGRYLYAGSATLPLVTRFDLTGASADLEIPLTGRLPATALVVPPGSSRSVVVAQGNLVTGDHFGPAAYDDATQRSLVGQSPALLVSLLRIGHPEFVVGLTSGFYSVDLIQVHATGVRVSASSWIIFSGAGAHEDDGRIVTHSEVFSVIPAALIGRFGIPGGNSASRSVSVDGRIYAIGGLGPTLHAFNYLTLTSIGSTPLPSGVGCTSLVRWGRNGLACLKPDRVFIIESNLVGLP